jgi:hypothetical protein
VSWGIDLGGYLRSEKVEVGVKFGIKNIGKIIWGKIIKESSMLLLHRG